MDTENRTSRKRNAFATALLTTLAFALGFAEFVLIGITPDVAEGLGEPLTLIGDLVGYYALACAVATPIVALATARADRFKVMAALLAVFNAGNLLTLFADGYALLLVSRVLPAVTSGTLLALALTYVPDIVEPKRVAAVLGLVLAGFSVSSVVGVPIGAALADLFDWKAAYACVFALGLAASVVLLPTLPRTPAHTGGAAPTLRSQLRLLADGRVLANIAMILAGAASTYVFYTYLAPILADVVGLDAAGTSLALLLFGAACVGSNLLSGWVAGRFGLRALPVAFAVHAALLALLAVSLPAGAVGIANILAVGLLMYVMNSTVQMLFQNVARRLPQRAHVLGVAASHVVQRGHRAGLVRGRPRGECGRASGHRPGRRAVRPGCRRVGAGARADDRASQRRNRRRGRPHCGDRPRAEVARVPSRRQTLRKGSLLHDDPSCSMPANNTAKACSCTLLSTISWHLRLFWLTKACMSEKSPHPLEN